MKPSHPKQPPKLTPPNLKPPDARESRLKQMRHQLMTIFIFYSSFGDRDNYRLLKIQNFKRMLLDAQIVTSEEQGKHYDILYWQNKNKTGLAFEEFLDMLPRLAEMHYARMRLSRKDALMKIMNQHFLILEEFITTKTELGEDIRYLSEPYDSRSFEVLAKVKPILEKIYREYWPSETLNDKNLNDKSLLSLLEFLREFELCPALLSKSVAFLVYEHLTSSELEHTGEQRFESLEFTSPGKEFTFKRFIKTLIVVALIGHKKIALDDQSQPRKVVRLLQRMQISSGFAKVQRTVQTSQLSRTSLLIPEQVIDAIQSGNSSKYSSVKRQRVLTENLDSDHKLGGMRSHSQSPKAMEVFWTKEQERVLEKYGNQLRAKFQLYCSYGDTLNTMTLKSIKISKILKEIDVLDLIGKAQLDLIISNYTRFSSSGKIQYPQFVQLLFEVATRAKLQAESLVKCIIAHEGANGEYAKKVGGLANRNGIGSQKAQVYTLLKEIEKPLRMYYEHYSGNKNMNFNQFSKFMYDFEIFPFLLSKPKLFQIFNEAATENEKNEKDSVVDRKLLSPNYSSVKSTSNRHNTSFSQVEKNINFELFKECIGLCSQQIQEQKLTQIEKLLLLLERMNDSKGPKLIIKALGNTRNAYGMKTDFLGQVRKKYAFFYEKDIFETDKSAEKDQGDFDSIFLS